MSDTEKKLKLYVWEEVLTDYTSGVMFALAESVDEARELITPGYAANLEGHSRGYEETDLDADPVVYDYAHGFKVWGGG